MRQDELGSAQNQIIDEQEIEIERPRPPNNIAAAPASIGAFRREQKIQQELRLEAGLQSRHSIHIRRLVAQSHRLGTIERRYGRYAPSLRQIVHCGQDGLFRGAGLGGQIRTESDIGYMPHPPTVPETCPGSRSVRAMLKNA